MSKKCAAAIITFMLSCPAHAGFSDAFSSCWQMLTSLCTKESSCAMSPAELAGEAAGLERAALRKIRHENADGYGFETVGVEMTENGPYYLIEHGPEALPFAENPSYADARFYTRIVGTRRERVAAPETLNKLLGLNRPGARFKFVAVDADEISGADFLRYLAKREYPISMRGTYFLHDLKAHAAAVYALIQFDGKVWNQLVRVAGVLVRDPEKNAQMIKQLMDSLDDTAHLGRNLQDQVWLKNFSRRYVKELTDIEKIAN